MWLALTLVSLDDVIINRVYDFEKARWTCVPGEMQYQINWTPSFGIPFVQNHVLAFVA